MNKNDYENLVSKSVPVTGTKADDLAEICQRFPFFQSAQILLAKSLKQSGSIYAEDQLKRAAIASPERAMFSKFMQEQELNDTNADITEEIKELNEENHEITAEATEVKIENLFEYEIHTPVRESYTIEDALTGIVPEQVALPDAETRDEQPGAGNESGMEQPAEAEIKNQAFTFLEWLNRNPMADSKNKEDTAANKKDKPDQPAEIKTATVELIDKFITNQPRIAPAQATFYSPVNMARKSVEESADLVSPTLAQIYYSQGNKRKAVEMYEKLQLLYPEKSALFAAQIEKIKSE